MEAGAPRSPSSTQAPAWVAGCSGTACTTRNCVFLRNQNPVNRPPPPSPASCAQLDEPLHSPHSLHQTRRARHPSRQAHQPLPSPSLRLACDTLRNHERATVGSRNTVRPLIAIASSQPPANNSRATLSHSASHSACWPDLDLPRRRHHRHHRPHRHHHPARLCSSKVPECLAELVATASSPNNADIH